MKLTELQNVHSTNKICTYAQAVPCFLDTKKMLCATKTPEDMKRPFLVPNSYSNSSHGGKKTFRRQCKWLNRETRNTEPRTLNFSARRTIGSCIVVLVVLCKAPDVFISSIGLLANDLVVVFWPTCDINLFVVVLYCLNYWGLQCLLLAFFLGETHKKNSSEEECLLYELLPPRWS